MTLTPNVQTAQAVTQNIGATEHPRILFTAGDIPRLRSQAASTHQSIWSPILEFSKSQLNSTPLSAPTCPDDLENMRNSGNQLIAFAFSYVITGDKAYLDLTKRHMNAYSAWTDWGDEGGCGGRDLGFHHMLLGFSLAYDWTYNDLSASERSAFGAQLALRTQQSYEASSANSYNAQWNNWWRGSYAQNHHAVNNSALGVAALTLKGADPRAQTWLNAAVDMMSKEKSILDGIGDGSWHEGLPYQAYGLTLSLPFMKSLRQLEGIDVTPHTYLRNYTYWRLYNLLPGSDRHLMSYGNFDWFWADAYAPQNVLRYSAAEYGDSYAEWTAQQVIGSTGRNADIDSAPWYVFEFLYYNPQVGASSPASLPESRSFSDLGAVILRDGWSGNDLVFGLKAGGQGGASSTQKFTSSQYPFTRPGVDAFNTAHDHQDAGTISLYRGGSELSSETVGYGLVDTKYHNTLLIDGKGQYRPPDEHGSYSYWGEDPSLFQDISGKIAFRDGTPNFEYVVADITNPYRLTNQTTGKPDSLMVNSLNRRVLFVKPGYFIVIDDIKSAGGHTYNWINHFANSASLDGGWIKGISDNNQILGVKALSPAGVTTQLGNDGKPYAQLTSPAGSKDLRFITVLYPTDSANWQSRPSVTLLRDDASASGVRVALNGTQDNLIRNSSQGQVTVGEYVFDGQAASVFKDGSGNLQRLTLIEGASLSDGSGSRALVKSMVPGTTLEANYQGQALAISGEAPDGTTFYAPSTIPSQVTLNGNAIPARKMGDFITVSRGGFTETPTPTKTASATPTKTATATLTLTSSPTKSPEPTAITPPSTTPTLSPVNPSTATPTKTPQPSATPTKTSIPIPTSTPRSGFTVRLSRAAPNRVPVLGGVELRMVGEGFASNATAFIGGTNCDNVQIISDTELTCTVRQSFEQLVDVTVVNPDGASDTLNGYLTYDPSLIAPSAIQVGLPIRKGNQAM